MNTPIRRRVWPWVAGALLLLALLTAAVGATALLGWFDAAHGGFHVVSDGHSWGTFDIDHDAGWAVLLGLGVAGVLTLCLVLLVVPMVVALALLGAALGIGIAVLAVLTVLAFALSPLWLLVWVVWWMARKPGPKGVAT